MIFLGVCDRATCSGRHADLLGLRQIVLCPFFPVPVRDYSFVLAVRDGTKLEEMTVQVCLPGTSGSFEFKGSIEYRLVPPMLPPSWTISALPARKRSPL